MESSSFDVVTGAFGYTGKYITRRLLALGRRVKTITGHPDRPNPFAYPVEAEPFNFDSPTELMKSLQGTDTLYITYWIRFEHGEMTYPRAIRNTQTLFDAAKIAGVRRIVYVSITNPSPDSRLPYFNGKAQLEHYLQRLGVSYGIVRPTVIFGPEDILINNIAYLLRHVPMFAVPGSGNYRLQPVFVEDMAEIVVDTGRREDDVTLDAVGPEVFTFNGLLKLIAETVGSSTRFVHMNPKLVLSMTGLVGRTVNDVVLTEDEIEGLMANLLVSENLPLGHMKLSEWLKENAETIGMEYHSEIGRHYAGGK